jgi:hypothetical protein
MAFQNSPSHQQAEPNSSPSHQLSLWPLAGNDSSRLENDSTVSLAAARCDKPSRLPVTSPLTGNTTFAAQHVLASAWRRRAAALPVPEQSVAVHPSPSHTSWQTADRKAYRAHLTRGQRTSIPLEWTGDEPPLKLARPWLRKQEIPMSQLSRHVMATGESGSGKTRSCIEPLLDPLLHYRLPSDEVAEGKAVSIGLIDVKGEFYGRVLQDLTQSGQADRLVRIGDPADRRPRRIRFFEGLEDLSIPDKLQKIDQVAPASWHSPDGHSAPWVDKAKSLLRSLAQAEAVYRTGEKRSLTSQALAHFHLPVVVGRQSFFEQVQRLLNHVCQDAKRLKALHQFLLGMRAGAMPARLTSASCRCT